VEEYHIEFTRCLNLHPADQPYGFDLLAATFWSNLLYDIHKMGVAEEFQVPQKLDNETNGQALEQLRVTKNQAESFDRHVQNIQDQVNHSQNITIHRTSQAQAFAAIPSQTFNQSDLGFCDPNIDPEDYHRYCKDYGQYEGMMALTSRNTACAIPY
jgi:hypothetical protein